MIYLSVQMILILFETGQYVYGQIDTSNAACPSYSAKSSQCNTATTVPGLGTLSATALSTFYTLDKSILCGTANKELFLTASDCLFTSLKNCADNDFKTFVTTRERYEEAVKLTCDKSDFIDHYIGCFGDSVQSCIRNEQARQGLTDGAAPDKSENFDKFIDYHCRRRAIEDECIFIDEDVDSCSSDSVVSTFRELRLLLKPPACSATAIYCSFILMLISLVLSYF